MNLGTLVTAAANGATNLVMLAMENGVYLLGGQGAVPGAGRADFVRMAEGAGWPTARRFDDAAALAAGWQDFVAAPGPAFASLAVEDPADQAMRLPDRHPGDALRAWRAHFAGSAGR
jgi:thiamine pyrophosphate-dependent acetolactate synthase large subunit-like protein